jgi:hypothetical protein
VSLNYNLLLGRIWTYSMRVVVWTIFWIICFPHEGRIVTMDYMESNLSDVAASPRTIVPWIENSQMTTESIGCGMYPSLMGCFDSPAPISYVCPLWSDSPSRVLGLSSISSLCLECRIRMIHGCYPHCLVRLKVNSMPGWMNLCLQWK